VQSLERGVRKIKMNENFFTGYRKNCVAPDEILMSIFVPQTKKNQHFVAFKQAKRRDDDIAIVTGAFNVLFETDSDIVQDIKFAYGGMAPTTILAPKTSLIGKGKRWNSEIVEIINQSLLEELPLSPSAPGNIT
jgi:xanthine dehydrogenase/oxidase